MEDIIMLANQAEIAAMRALGARGGEAWAREIGAPPSVLAELDRRKLISLRNGHAEITRAGLLAMHRAGMDMSKALGANVEIVRGKFVFHNENIRNPRRRAPARNNPRPLKKGARVQDEYGNVGTVEEAPTPGHRGAHYWVRFPEGRTFLKRSEVRPLPRAPRTPKNNPRRVGADLDRTARSKAAIERALHENGFPGLELLWLRESRHWTFTGPQIDDWYSSTPNGAVSLDALTLRQWVTAARRLADRPAGYGGRSLESIREAERLYGGKKNPRRSARGAR